MAHTGLVRLTAALALTAAVGCGARTYPVKGTVTFADGKPATELAGGSVVFESAEGPADDRVSATGPIDREGNYQLTTSRPGDGVPAGKYRVLVAPPEEEGGADDRPNRPRPKAALHPRFKSFAGSKLEVTVEAKANDIPLRVERAK